MHNLNKNTHKKLDKEWKTIQKVPSQMDHPLIIYAFLIFVKKNEIKKEMPIIYLFNRLIQKKGYTCRAVSLKPFQIHGTLGSPAGGPTATCANVWPTVTV
jgi:hypothetical protein